jgi:putative tryptophan/tyrosine transport system substrate-binding protein
MTYGVNQKSSFVRAAEYIDKVLRGAKPGELPGGATDEVPSCRELKTAKALGLTIRLLARADEVIE